MMHDVPDEIFDDHINNTASQFQNTSSHDRNLSALANESNQPPKVVEILEFAENQYNSDN